MENSANSGTPNPQFIRSIQAGLRYWQQKTETLGPEQVAWLDSRRQNLHQAVLFGLNQSETWEDTVQLLLQAFDFSEWRGYWPEWIPVFEQALAKAPEKETVLFGRLQNRLGQLYRLDNRLAEAEGQHQRALALAQRLVEEELLANTYNCLAELHLSQKNVDLTKVYGRAALGLTKSRPGFERLEAFTRTNLGRIEEFVGNWPEAIAHYDLAAKLWRELKNHTYLARSLNDLGNVYTNTNEFAKAQQAYEEAGVILESTNNVKDKAYVYSNLGVLYYRQEKWEEAKTALLHIDPLALRAQNELNLLASFYNNLGNVYVKLAQWPGAEENLKLAVEMFRSLNDKINLGNSLGTLATAYVGLGEPEAAKSCFEEGLALLRQYPQSEFANRVINTYTTAYEALEVKEKDKT